MNPAILFNFEVDKESNSIHVKRSFNAAIDLVWAAWTEPDILDQWWAPKPYKSVTKSMDFRVGGSWLYYMFGPEGDIYWSLFDYESIDKEKSFGGIDAFCDENGKINDTKPRVKWRNEFLADADSTLVNIHLNFETLKDLETIIQMGFKEGFTAGLENLDQYINAHFSEKTE